MRNEPKDPAFTSLWISERTYHIRIWNIPYIPDGLRTHSLPTTEFCKTAATATTLPSETTMNRAFRRVVAALFFMHWKGPLPPLLPLFYPRTSEGRGRYMRRRATTHRKKVEGTDTQNPGTRQTKLQLHTNKTTVTTRWNHRFILTELKFQPDETVVPTLRNRLKL